MDQTLRNLDVGSLKAGTHLPLLLSAILESTGPVLEIGCGHCSTPLLHAVCGMLERELWSVESDPGWLDLFSSRYAGSGHHFAAEPPAMRERWGAVLIDQSPGSDRINSILSLVDHADYLIVHDVQAEDVMGPIRPHLVTLRHWIDDRYDVHAMILSRDYDLPKVI